MAYFVFIGNSYETCDDLDQNNKPALELCLVLREWRDINPASEYRCFVRNRQLLGLSCVIFKCELVCVKVIVLLTEGQCSFVTLQRFAGVISQSISRILRRKLNQLSAGLLHFTQVIFFRGFQSRAVSCFYCLFV